jgi:hypothetical protein
MADSRAGAEARGAAVDSQLEQAAFQAAADNQAAAVVLQELEDSRLASAEAWAASGMPDPTLLRPASVRTAGKKTSS